MKSGLYVSPGWSAAAMDAAWANWLPVPTTNSPNVLRGLKCRPLLLVSVGNDGSIMESPPPVSSIEQHALVSTTVHRLINSCSQLFPAPLGGRTAVARFFGRSGNLREAL